MRRWSVSKPLLSKKAFLRALAAAQVAHELRGGFHDVARRTEGLSVDQPVVALIGRAKSGELVGMRHPVEVTAVDNATAHGRRLPVHVFGGGMHHNVGSPLEGAAVDRGGKGVVDHQRHTLLVRHAGEALNVTHATAGVGDRFTEHELRVGTEGGTQFLVACIQIDQRAVDTHFLHRHHEEVERSTVDAVGGNEMSAGLTDVEHRIKARRLTARSEHAGHTAFERGNLRSSRIAGGVLQARIEIARLLQVEEAAHLFSAFIFERGALINRQLTRFAVLGRPTRLHALRVDR